MRIVLAAVLLWFNPAQAASLTHEGAPQTGPTASLVEEVNRLNKKTVELVDKGSLDEALSVAKQALDIAGKRLESEHSLVALSAKNLATIYFAKKEWYDAAKYYQKSLAEYEKALGPNDPKLAEVLYGLGWSSYAIGETARAESCLLRSVSIREKVLGAESRETAESLYIMGQFYQKSGKGKQAVEFYKRAIPIYEKTAGKTDRELGELLEKCACALMQTGQKQESAGMGLRSQMILHKNPTRNVLGYVIQGRAIVRAEPVYPAAAKQERIAGTVMVEVTVDETGRVITARPLCGPDLLVGAAVDAAKNWRFTPSTLGGNPVKLVGTITFNFHL